MFSGDIKDSWSHQLITNDTFNLIYENVVMIKFLPRDLPSDQHSWWLSHSLQCLLWLLIPKMVHLRCDCNYRCFAYMYMQYKLMWKMPISASTLCMLLQIVMYCFTLTRKWGTVVDLTQGPSWQCYTVRVTDQCIAS